MKKLVSTLITLFLIISQLQIGILYSETPSPNPSLSGTLPSSSIPEVEKVGEEESKKDIETSSVGQNKDKKNYNPPISYSELMHKINALEKRKINLEETKKTVNNLEKFINYEKEIYEKLNISKNKQEKYFKFLNKKLEKLKNNIQSFSGNGKTSLKLSKSLNNQVNTQINHKLNTLPKTPDFIIPENPSKFNFNDKKINIETIDINTKSSQKNNPQKLIQDTNTNISQKNLNQTQNIHTQNINTDVQDTNLEILPEDLPQIQDLQFDEEQTILNSEILKLAEELGNNPTKIANFVRNNIKYKPYYGAKKGAIGCLKEKVCNDTDTSSLTISLLRASGIPARYKNTLAYLSKDQLLAMFGVDELKTIYASLSRNNVPVYISGEQLTSSETITGNNLDNYDFSNIENLIVNRTFVEAFIEYDHNKGNFSSDGSLVKFSGTGTTEELREELQKDPKYNQKGWFPIDSSFKILDYQKKEILNDTASFDIESFWKNFFRYNGDLSPLEKYKTEIREITNKDITDSNYISTKQIIKKDYDELPPNLAYYTLSDYLRENNLTVSGINTDQKAFSVLPNGLKHKLEINLLKKETREPVFSIKLPASEINNVPINLTYKGASDEDKELIKNHGGIHATPSSLIDIRAYIELDTNGYRGYESYLGTGSIKIGDSLVLEFKHILNKYDKLVGLNIGDETEELIKNISEKFSVAGNDEGIYISMSSIIQDNPRLNLEGSNLNSKILLEGNSEIARQYLKRLEINNDVFSRSLDVDFNTHMKRAVVTQNRVLSLDGDNNPTTFDFKGLTLDASSHISSYSNRGNYGTHNRDFTLLFGLQASYDEGEIFKDIAGLEGISTVSGLQYAYENNYLVYEITGSNSGVIDSLSLSENTKENMRSDIERGNTIITPSSFVVSDNWRGLFYVSLEGNGGASYAIGEQVGSNGGWTTVSFGNEEIGVFKNEGDVDNFIFSEGVLGSKKCRISRAEFSEIVLSSGYSSDYGLPCLMEYKDFNNIDNFYGDKSFVYVLTTKGAKFSASTDGGNSTQVLYSYWEKQLDVENKINVLTNTYSSGKKGKFKFSPIVGTYIQHFCTDYNDSLFFPKCYDGDEGTIYYSPSSSGNRDIYLVKGDLLEKLADSDNHVVSKLLFAVGDEEEAPEYVRTNILRNINGDLQWFFNGQICRDTTWLNETYFIPGEIQRCFNNPSLCGKNGDGGTGGRFGFPINDPQKATDGSWYQGFTNNEEIRLSSTGSASVVGLRYYRCQVEEYKDASQLKLEYYRAHGVLNGIGDTVEGGAGIIDLGLKTPGVIGGVIKSIGNAIAHPIDTYNEVKMTLDELRKIMKEVSWQQVWDVAGSTGNAVVQSAKAELESNTCFARKYYLEGYIVGSLVGGGGILKGVSKLSQLPSKLRESLNILLKKKNALVSDIRLLSKLKPIRSIDLEHTNLKHKFGSTKKGGKFLEGADIDGIIREGYSKRGKRLKESKSEGVYTGKPFNSIHIEVDMGRTIGTNKNYNMNYPYSKLTIIVDYDGNIVSAYPMSEFEIKKP